MVMPRVDALLRPAAALAAWLLVVGAMTSCRVDEGDMAMTPAEPISSAAGPTGLPPVGPIPGASHWHAAYVVRICNDVLDPFDSEDDPLGIHSHGDGVMHVHPFVEESGYENARVALFADAMGFAVSDGELRLPDGGVWRDGDLCDGVPGRVFVDRWEGPGPESGVVRHFEDLADLRFLADGELYQIAFAPPDSTPVVPPAIDLLPQLSDLTPPPEPWVDIDPGSERGEVAFFRIGEVGSEPCDQGALAERVLRGPVRCFEPEGDMIPLGAAVAGARAVELNRRPAVEIEMGDALLSALQRHFGDPGEADAPYALAIAVGGEVVSAPQVVRLPPGDRLVVSGGFTVETARRLAGLLDTG